MTKHPNKEFRLLITELRDQNKKKEIYEAQEQRGISWHEYNFSKINEYKNDFKFIRESVNKIKFEQKRSVGRPPVDKKALVKAILVCEVVGLPERQAQGFLEIIGPFLGIHELIDDRVISNAYDDNKIAEIMYQLFLETRSSNGVLGGDGTGLERSRKENYESTKKKKAGQYMTSIVDSREIVQAFDISGIQECQIMHELIKIVRGNSLRLDAGFNDRELAKEMAELGMRPFIFPRKDNNINGDPYWQAMYLTFYWDIINWLIEYHQRSHTESFHSSFKRTFGILTKLKLNAKFVQVCARIIIHNARRLSYFDSL
jgi:transposase